MKSLNKTNQIQITNNMKKFIFLFVISLFITVPSYQVKANMLAVAEMNGGGGGGGGSTGSTTTTSGSTVAYGTISLTVTPNSDQPYTGSSPITLSSNASVSVCSNTELDLKVTAQNVSPIGTVTDWGTLFDQHTVGGVQIIKSNTFTTSSDSGVNTVNLTATRYDPSGYSIEYSGGQVLTSLYSAEVVAYGSTYYVSTNYRGRILSVGSLSGYNNVSIDLIKNASDDNSLSYGGSIIESKYMSSEAIKTYTMSFTYTVGTPSVSVTKTSTQAIPFGTTDKVFWSSNYATHCTCYTDPSFTNRCKDKGGNIVPQAIKNTIGFETEVLSESKTYYIKCDNLP